MTNLSTLKKTIEESSIEEIQASITAIRSSRRNYIVVKAIQTRQKSIDKAIAKTNVDDLKALLKTLENSE